MNSTPNTSRRVRSLHKAIGFTVAACLLAGSLSACKTMENLSEKEKILVAAGSGILAAIVGKAAQTEKSGSTGSAGGGGSAAAGADVDECALVEAAGEGDMNTVKRLLGSGMDVNACTNPMAGGALEAALLDEHFDIAKLLVESGANVNNSIEGYCMGNQEVMPRMPEGQTTLGWAVSSGRMDIIRLLVERGANVNGNEDEEEGDGGGYPLRVAAQMGRMDIVQFLLEKGAKANVEAPCGSPLAWALANGHKDIANVLIKHGASKKKAQKELAAAKRGEDWTPAGLTATLTGQKGYSDVGRYADAIRGNSAKSSSSAKKGTKKSTKKRK